MQAAIAILSARETPNQLLATIRAAVRGLSESAVVDVLVNGNQLLAESIREQLNTAQFDAKASATIRLWFVPAPDKANAFNKYLLQVWPGSEAVVFIDGYAVIAPEAINHLFRALKENTGANAATGIPTSGRSARRQAKEMTEHGGIHGNLWAISGRTIHRIRMLGIKVPLGIYRLDPLIGALLAFDLDPLGNEWNLLSRIAVVPAATWEAPTLRWWRMSDIRTHLRRRERQAQGDLETRAYQYHFFGARLPPSAMPRTTAELIRNWFDACKPESIRYINSNRLRKNAYNKLMQSRSWPEEEEHPRLIQTLQVRRHASAPDDLQSKRATL